MSQLGVKIFKYEYRIFFSGRSHQEYHSIVKNTTVQQKVSQIIFVQMVFPFCACLTIKVIISFYFHYANLSISPSTWSSLFPILSKYVPWLLLHMMPVPRLFAKKHTLVTVQDTLSENHYFSGETKN